MRRNSTPVHSTQKVKLQTVSTAEMMVPKETTLNKILQFASTYRVEKVSKHNFIEYYLN